MKKFLTSGLILALVLGLATASPASTVYMDVWNGGEFDTGSSTKKNLSQIAVGLNIPMNEFKFSCELTDGTIDCYGCKDDFDTSGILLTGGYALVNDRQLRVDITGGFYERTLSFYYRGDEKSYYSSMLGFDAKLKLDKKAWLDFNYAFGINPRYHYYDYIDIDSISLLKCKFNYRITREFGAALGYNCETIKNGSYKNKYSGITLGAFLRF
jgi:hypothetical protein